MTEHVSCPEEPDASPGGKMKPRPQATGQDYGFPELWFVIVQSSRAESGIRKRRGWQRLTAFITWWERGVKKSHHPSTTLRDPEFSSSAWRASQWSQCPRRWQAGAQALFGSPIASTSSPVRNYGYINNNKKVLSLRDNLQMGQLMEIVGFHAKEFGLFLKAKGVYWRILSGYMICNFQRPFGFIPIMSFIAKESPKSHRSYSAITLL